MNLDEQRWIAYEAIIKLYNANAVSHLEILMKHIHAVLAELKVNGIKTLGATNEFQALKKHVEGENNGRS